MPTPPRQERSRRTLDRLVEACEGLLREKRFEEVSVAELAEKGRSSVGAFYGRFQGKDELLDFLDSRGEEEVRKRWDDYFQSERERRDSEEEAIRRFVMLSTAGHRRRKGVLRALFLRLRQSPTPEMLARARRMNRKVIEGLQALLAERRKEIRHPRPELAILIGLVMVVSSIREWVVFEDLELYPERLDDDVLAEELARAFSAYLGVASAGGRRPGRRRRRRK